METDIGIDSFLVRRELIEAIVRRAELYERFIEKDRRMPVKIENLIKVRLACAASSRCVNTDAVRFGRMEFLPKQEIDPFITADLLN
jgi:hypothetical protein